MQFVLGRYEYCNLTLVCTKSAPNKRKTSLKKGFQYDFKPTLELFVCGENVFGPPSHLWTKLAAVLNFAIVFHSWKV